MTQVSTTRLENRCNGIIGSAGPPLDENEHDEPDDERRPRASRRAGRSSRGVPPTSRPMISEPIVTASSSAPATSMRAGRRGNGRSRANQLTTAAIEASGTLMKKIHGHDHCSMMNPPISGPKQRRADEGEREVADVAAALARREDVAEDGERQRLDRTAAEALDDPGADQLVHALRESAQQRADDEQADRDLQDDRGGRRGRRACRAAACRWRRPRCRRCRPTRSSRTR